MTTRQRGLLWQAAVACVALGLLAWMAVNIQANMASRNIGFGYGFLGATAGFDIPFRLLDWSVTDTYGRALLVSVTNTLFAAAICIVTASALGLLLALMRLSGNPLAAGTSRGIVELVRNTPQLLQIVFFYLAVLQVLPGLRSSIVIADSAFLNVRGLYLPAPSGGPWGWIILGGAVALGVVALLWRRLGFLIPRSWVLWPALLAVLVLAGFTATWEFPALRGFNFTGGVRVVPELLALILGVTIYTSAFVSEIIRAAILGVPRGQSEAARSLGLSAGRTMALVVLPQALRILIPPLTSQYLNIIKSTTLGAAIAYPEVLQIFARTVLNQSGRAIEVMTLLLGVFLAINLLVSAAMGAWNRAIALKER